MKFQFALFSFLMGLIQMAGATGPDFSGLTGSVDFSTAIAAILLVLGLIGGVDIVWAGGVRILKAIKKAGS